MHRFFPHRAPGLTSRIDHGPVAAPAARLVQVSILLACLLMAALAAFWAGNDTANAGVSGRDTAQVSPVSPLNATSPLGTPTVAASAAQPGGGQTSVLLVGFVLVGLVAAVVLVVLRRRQT
jgi:hypothetical protein